MNKLLRGKGLHFFKAVIALSFIILLVLQSEAANVWAKVNTQNFKRDERGSLLSTSEGVNRKRGANESSKFTATYSSISMSAVFTKNNCPSGTSGSQVTYTVPAGKYTSEISQADANQKAKHDIDTNGQLYANVNGACKNNQTNGVLLR